MYQNINMRKKIKLKVLLIVLLITAIAIGFFIYNKNAANNLKKSQEFEIAEYSEEYKEWLKLPEEKKSNTVKPRSFNVNVEDTKSISTAMESASEETYPEKYDLRTYNGVKGVKNQRSWGLCWAYAGTSSLESHLLNKTRSGIYNTCTRLDYDLNPMHEGYALAYSFSYNVDNLYGNRPLDYGGNNIDNALYWASGIGPVSTDNFSITSESLPVEMSANEVLVQTEDIQVENALFFPSFDMTTATQDQKTEFINLIKQNILENGAISFASMGPSNGTPGYNSQTQAVYIESQYEVALAPHMMLIVGWDDTFSKENFNTGYISGEKPSMDGAWIVQNSWGEEVGLGGYYYYSYEDYGLNSNDLFVVSEVSTKDYNNIYQYNPNGEIRNCTGNYAANVFTKTDSGVEELTEISFFNFYPNTEYKIYVNSVDASLAGENVKLVKTYTDTNSFSEYITIKLDEPIRLTGNKFAIILEVNNEEQTYNIPIQSKAHSYLENEQVNIREGQSFLSYDGQTWMDIINVQGQDWNGNEWKGASVLIKAFTNNSSEDTNVVIKSTLNKDEIYLKGEQEGLLVTSITKNVTDINKLSYEIYNENNENVTNIFNISKSLNGNAYYANIVIPSDYTLLGNYTLRILYNEETKEELNFTIYRKQITSIDSAKNEIYLQVGDTNKLAPKLQIKPTEILDPIFEYKILDEKIATVDSTGVVTAIQKGNTEIQINSLDGGNVTKTVKINVVDLSEKLEGEGSPENPYLISTAEELNLIKADLDAHYRLTNNIDLSEATAEGGIFYNDGKGWEPIGFLQKEESVQVIEGPYGVGTSYWTNFNNSDAFKGVLDGNNFTISGLNINRPNENAIALFEIVENGTIKNLKIRNSSITGKKYVASFATYCTGATLENISNGADIYGWSNLAGITSNATNNTKIEKAYNFGNVTQNVYYMEDNSLPGYMGGITSGLKESTINMACNTGNISRYNSENTPDVGGITAVLIDGNITNTYNTGKINGGFCVGGIAGEIYYKGNIQNVYNIGEIAQTDSWIGEIAGYIETLTLTIDNVYTISDNIQALGSRVYIEDQNNSVVQIEEKTLEELKQKETYEGFDFENTWIINENETPKLKLTDERKAEGLKIKKLPNKLEYVYNIEKLDLEGLELVLVYNDATEQIIEVTEDMVTGFDNTVEGEQTITITYNDYKATFIIEIYKRVLQDLYIDVYSYITWRTNYTEGETFDPGTTPLIASYDDGTTKEIDISKDCIISKEGALELTDTVITISYTEGDITKSIEIEINVLPKVIEGLEGEGSEENPYLISTPEELNKIRQNPLLHYKLKNDIDMKEATSEGGALYNNGQGWEPIGRDLSYSDTPFEGSLDGNGFAIIGLNVCNSDVWIGATLFGAVNGGTLKNLTIKDSNFEGVYVSGFACNIYNDSKLINLSIQNCTLKSNYTIAGIARWVNESTIKYCSVVNCNMTNQYTIGEYEGEVFAGGIVGTLYKSQLSDCYNESDIVCINNQGGDEHNYIGGIVAQSHASTINNTYNTGSITKGTQSGGICGYAISTDFTNNYDISDEIPVLGYEDPGMAGASDIELKPCTLTNTIEKELEELKQKATYEGFDFYNIWQINEGEMPIFRTDIGNKDLTKVEITVPTPKVGEIPANKEQIIVKANDSINFEVLEVYWMKYNNESKQYETWEDENKIFEEKQKYLVNIGYKRPNSYIINENINITVNGNEINPNNIEEFNAGSAGDAYCDYDAVYYVLGEAKKSMYGDVNLDDKIDMQDAIYLAGYLNNKPGYVLEESAQLNADVNCDGKVEWKDQVILLNHVSGKEGYETLPCVKCGDVNCDGKVDIEDAIYLAKVLNKIEGYTLEGQPLKNADTNNDEKVEWKDQIILLNYVKGVEGYETLPSTKCGDANCDGKVDIEDAIYLSRYLNNVEGYNLTEQATKNADTNNDEKIEWKDQIILLNYVKGVEGYETLPCVKCGDVNCDGKVDIEDAIYLSRYLNNVEGYSLTEQATKNADTNNDEKVEWKDQIILLNYVKGVEGYETIPSTKCGDVNCDGKIDIEDAIYLSRYLNKLEGYNLTEQATKNADVNCDGKIEWKDQIILLNYVKGVEGYETLPCVKCGDVTVNGIVDIDDAVYLSRYLNKLEGYEITERGLKNADTNADEKVDWKDQEILVKHVRKEEGYETLPVIPKEEPEEVKVINVSSTGNDTEGNGTENSPYLTINKAFEVAESGTTIKLLSNVNLTEGITLTEGEYTLDLNGYELAETANNLTDWIQIFTLNNTAKLTVQGEKEGSKITTSAHSGGIFFADENTELNINGGEYINNTAWADYIYTNVFLIRDNSKLTINDGCFKSEACAFYIEGIEEENININGGEYIAPNMILVDYNRPEGLTNPKPDLKELLGENKVFYDVDNERIAQIMYTRFENNTLFWGNVDSAHTKVVSSDEVDVNLDNEYKIMLHDYVSSYKEVITIYDSVILKNYDDKLLGYSTDKNSFEPDYAFNGEETLIINNLSELADENNKLTLYEVYETYNISYDLNGGNLSEGEEIDGSTIAMWAKEFTLPTLEPTKENYVFGGWAEDPNTIYGNKGTMSVSPEETCEEITLYAVWLPEWYANAEIEEIDNQIIYNITITGQDELNELLKVNKYFREYAYSKLDNQAKVAKHVITINNNENATKDLQINNDIEIGYYTTFEFTSNVEINANVEVQGTIKLFRVGTENERDKIGFTGTGSIILKYGNKLYVGTRLFTGRDLNASIIQRETGYIVLSKDPKTDVLVMELKDGISCTIASFDFDTTTMFESMVDYTLKIDEGATLIVKFSTNVIGTIENKGTIQIEKGNTLQILENGKYDNKGIGTITGEGTFTNNSTSN